MAGLNRKSGWAAKYETLGDLANEAYGLTDAFLRKGQTRDVRLLDSVLERVRKLRPGPKDQSETVRIKDGRHSLHEHILQAKMLARALEQNEKRETRAELGEKSSRLREIRDHWYHVANERAREAAARAREKSKGTSALLNQPKVGAVVRFVGRRRRYVVTKHDPVGPGVSLVALSGAFAGSGPSGVHFKKLVIDADQQVKFTGKLARKLEARAAWELGRQKAAELGARAATAAATTKPEKGSEAEAVRSLLTQGLALASDGRRLQLVLERLAVSVDPSGTQAKQLDHVLANIRGLHGPAPSARRMFPAHVRLWDGTRTLFTQVRGLGQPAEAVQHVKANLRGLDNQNRQLADLARKHGPHAMPSGGLPPPAAVPITGKVSARTPTKHALEQAARIVHDAWHKYLEHKDRSPPGPYGINQLDVQLDQARALGLPPGEEGRIVALVKKEHAAERARKQKQRDHMLRLAAKAKAAEEKAARAEAAAKKKQQAAAGKIDRAALAAQVRFLKSSLRHWTQAAEALLKAREQATLGHNHLEQQRRLERAGELMQKARAALEECVNRGMSQQPLFR